MNKLSFLVVLCFLSAGTILNAQKQLTVIYEGTNNNDGVNISKYLLAINDSVAYTTTISHRGKEYKYAIPLGSGFFSHDTYVNLPANQILRQSEPYGRGRYLVEDTIKKLAWQDAEGEKLILGYKCKKAAAQDGNLVWVAWYSPELSFTTGPNGIGGLSGLVLELSNINSHYTYKAIKIENNAPPIVIPSKGKKITAAAFSAMLQKMK